MGYRHQVMSDSMVPAADKLPKWFVEKYERYIDFRKSFWVSNNEYKRYGILADFETDIQKAIQDMNKYHRFGINLVFYADEGGNDCPDIKFVHIDKDEIIEKYARDWEIADYKDGY